MSRVFELNQPYLSALSKALERLELKDRFGAGERIAIKCHFGEYENLCAIRPALIEKIASEIKAAGAEPFVIDSITLYNGSRSTIQKHLDTARKNGFTAETIGCYG